jgi:ParB family chromosome partitioning protein
VPEDQLIPLGRIEDPARPARTVFDEAELATLVESIRAVGLLEPLGVFLQEGGQYEVIFGHRRLLSCRRAPLDPVPCMVYARDEAGHAMKIAENVDRAELSTTDEALYYGRLFEELGEDTEKVAAVVRKPLTYVEGRLLLLRGYDDVFDALRDGTISLGVAQELNALTEARDAEFYLDAAVRGGCTVRQMRIWREQANATARFAARAGAAVPDGEPAAATATTAATPPLSTPSRGSERPH